ncbi:MAG: hypothetical protein R3C58_06435 [Parvularculaceae bacterium]
MRHATKMIFASIALSACATTQGHAPSSVEAGAPAKPVFALSQISGKDGKVLDALLGAPDLARKEGEGEFRRYALARCSLMIVLYPDESGVKRAASIDAGALKSGDEKPDLDACLAGGK